jgi:xanthine dehydrogenase molybdenum-binding subunit
MEVEVDTDTGEVEITNVVCVNDVGKAMSPESTEAQQYGGMIMAASRGRSEEVLYDPSTGVKLNANLLDYKVATILDCGPIESILIESGMGYGPYGAEGIGENVADHPASLISLAVYNAIGKWVEEFPVTPEKVLKTLGNV